MSRTPDPIASNPSSKLTQDSGHVLELHADVALSQNSSFIPGPACRSPLWWRSRLLAVTLSPSAVALFLLLCLAVLTHHHGAASSPVGEENTSEHDERGKKEQASDGILQLGDPRFVPSSCPVDRPALAASFGFAATWTPLGKPCAIFADAVIRGRTRLGVVHQLMHQGIVGIIPVAIRSITWLVVLHHFIQILHLVVSLSSTRNAVLVVVVVDSKRTIAGTVQTQVTVVGAFTVGQIVKAIRVVTIVVEVSIVSLEIVDKFRNTACRYELHAWRYCVRNHQERISLVSSSTSQNSPIQQSCWNYSWCCHCLMHRQKRRPVASCS